MLQVGPRCFPHRRAGYKQLPNPFSQSQRPGLHRPRGLHTQGLRFLLAAIFVPRSPCAATRRHGRIPCQTEDLGQTWRAVLHCRAGPRGLQSKTEAFRAHNKWDCLSVKALRDAVSLRPVCGLCTHSHAAPDNAHLFASFHAYTLLISSMFLLLDSPLPIINFVLDQDFFFHLPAQKIFSQELHFLLCELLPTLAVSSHVPIETFVSFNPSMDPCVVD